MASIIAKNPGEDYAFMRYYSEFGLKFWVLCNPVNDVWGDAGSNRCILSTSNHPPPWIFAVDFDAFGARSKYFCLEVSERRVTRWSLWPFWNTSKFLGTAPVDMGSRAVRGTRWTHGRWEDGGNAAVELCPMATYNYTVDLAATSALRTREVSVDCMRNQTAASLLFPACSVKKSSCS